MMLFEEHHKWKVMIWLVESSPTFPSNLGMSEGSLVGMVGHVGSCNIRSLVSLVRSDILREAKYVIWGCGGRLVPSMVGMFCVLDSKRGFVSAMV
jgi:hypothetical protein